MKTLRLSAFTVLLVLGFTFSAQPLIKKSTTAFAQNIPASDTSALIAQGEQNVAMFCNACHAPKESEDAMLAPPFAAVKSHYMNADITQDEFVANMVAFLNDPSAEKSKMKGAVRRFEVMPKIPLTEAQFEAIATYLFHTDIEAPSWFEAHQKEMHGKGQGHGSGMGQGHGK